MPTKEHPAPEPTREELLAKVAFYDATRTRLEQEVRDLETAIRAVSHLPEISAARAILRDLELARNTYRRIASWLRPDDDIPF